MDEITILNLISVLHEKGKDSGAGTEREGGQGAVKKPKAERKEALLSSIVINAIQDSKLSQNPVFLSLILYVYTTGYKDLFVKRKLYPRKRQHHTPHY